MMELMHYLGEHLAEILLTIGTFGLWWSTARMNHIEKSKMINSLSHDNDNMAHVAEMAIEHSDRHMEHLHTLKRVSRRNRKGGIR
jgi:hypothetical protein